VAGGGDEQQPQKLSLGGSGGSSNADTAIAAVQTVPKDAAMLELIPRGDVFASHKLASSGVSNKASLPAHLGEKLALFEQSFSVLRFPHKAYQPVVLDPPAFDQTYHVDTIVLPTASAAANAGGSSSGADGGSASAAPMALSGLLRTSKSVNLHADLAASSGESIEARPTKLKTASQFTHAHTHNVTSVHFVALSLRLTKCFALVLGACLLFVFSRGRCVRIPCAPRGHDGPCAWRCGRQLSSVASGSGGYRLRFGRLWSDVS
jgi:hypothetical protein